MNILIIVFLVISLSVTITLLILRRKEITKIQKKLEFINNNDTNSETKISYPNDNLQGLLTEINKTLQIKKETEGKYKEMDMELRQAIANMSHDLRTPLTSIMGYIQLMEDENISNEERKEYLTIIKSRSENLKELVSGFYDLSRLQAEEYTIDMEKINLGVILSELIATFYNELISLEPEIYIEEKISFVYGDITAVKRIFTNLIQNVLKHADGKLRISLKEECNNIHIIFCNKTSKLSYEDAPIIFQRFFIADRMRTGQNTGLGLAITKELVERQGQKIWAEKKGDMLYINIIWNIIDSKHNRL